MKLLNLALILLITLLLTALATGCGAPGGGLERLDGQIFWEDGGVLPANSLVTISVVNASLAGTTDMIAQTVFEAEGQSPLDFFVEFPAASVDQRSSYTASVRIAAPDGQLLYESQIAQLVIENGQLVPQSRLLVRPV